MAGNPLIYGMGCEALREFAPLHRGLFSLLVVVVVLLWSPLSAPGQEKISVSGITESIEDVTLSLSVAGTVSRVFFDEGDKVKRGQCILELDRRLEELEVARRKLIWESKAEVESAEARVLTLKSQLKSTRDLFESTGSVSREELEEKELEYKLAVAEQKRLVMEEEKQRIEYEMALENLSKRRLPSPIGGVVIKLFLDVGESCEPEQPLAHVVDPGKCLFICNLEEWLGRTLKPGQVVDLAIRTGYETIAKKGNIVFVSPVVDAASGLLEVKAQFENQDGEVRPGVAGSMLLKAP